MTLEYKVVFTQRTVLRDDKRFPRSRTDIITAGINVLGLSGSHTVAPVRYIQRATVKQGLSVD